jgi:hypothetical protein
MCSPVLKDIEMAGICRSFIHYAFPLDVMSPYGLRWSGLSNYTNFWVMSVSIKGLTKAEQWALNAEKEVQKVRERMRGLLEKLFASPPGQK